MARLNLMEENLRERINIKIQVASKYVKRMAIITQQARVYGHVKFI